MRGAESPAKLVHSTHNSTMPLPPKTVSLSIEGDYGIVVTGGGVGRMSGPANAKPATRRTERDGEGLRSISSFSRMGSRVGGIVRSSCVSGSTRQAAFSTFTYSSGDADLKRAKHDAGLLARRLKSRYPPLEYLLVLEPHDKGDWHIHAVFLLPEGVAVSSAEQTISDAWDRGRARTVAVTDANGLADYLSPFSPKKRARWKFYPPGVRTYFVSAGMPRPTVVKGLCEAEAVETIRSLGGKYVGSRTFGPPGEDVGKKAFYRI